MSTLVVVYNTFRMLTSGYDENITAFIYALGAGSLTVVMLMIFRMIDDEAYLKQKRLRLFSNIFGTPVILLIVYSVLLLFVLTEYLFGLVKSL